MRLSDLCKLQALENLERLLEAYRDTYDIGYDLVAQHYLVARALLRRAERGVANLDLANADLLERIGERTDQADVLRILKEETEVSECPLVQVPQATADSLRQQSGAMPRLLSLYNTLADHERNVAGGFKTIWLEMRNRPNVELCVIIAGQAFVEVSYRSEEP